MNVKWTTGPTDPSRHYMRVGLVRATVHESQDGNLAYTVFVLKKGVKSIIHRVAKNPIGPTQVNAYVRCEHIAKCYDKYLGVGMLEIEHPGIGGAIYQPDNIPKSRDGAIIEGVSVGRVYRMKSTGSLYTIVAVANTNAKDQVSQPPTVVYRSVKTSETFCLTLQEFKSGIFELVNIGEVVDLGLNFYKKINRLEGVTNEL